MIDAGVEMVSWEGVDISSNEVALVHGRGLPLFVWTINNAAQITNFINMGVDGIVTDDPWAVRGVPPPTNYTTNPPAPPTFLADRIVSYWNMDDGLSNSFATTISDSEENNDGTLVRNDGASHWLDSSVAKIGGCLKLEGANAFVTIPQSTSLDINTNEMSFSAWVWLQNLPAQLTTSFGSIFDSTTDCYVLYLDKANNELRFKVTGVNGHAARPGIPANFLHTNEWLHIAAVFNGNFGSAGRASIYLNGVLMDAHTGNDGTPGTGLTSNLKTGQAASMGREGATGSSYFSGMVDDFAIWKRALTEAEIQRVFNNGQQGQSLGELLIQPSDLLVISSIQHGSTGIQINFRNLGSWTSFQLGRATNIAGPFLPISNLAPTSLGEGNFRFDYSVTDTVSEFFRIEGF
jgi:hypothetical protein